jgi:hypothetical protein
VSTLSGICYDLERLSGTKERLKIQISRYYVRHKGKYFYPGDLFGVIVNAIKSEGSMNYILKSVERDLNWKDVK